MSPDHAVLPVHRHPGKVADVLVASRQLVKQRRLSAVLVSDKGKGQHHSLRQRISRSLWMEYALLAEARVRRPFPFPGFLFLRCLFRR